MSKILLGLILAFSFVQYTPTAIAKGSKKSKKSKNKKNVDKEITNARMRQASGAKKKWSFSGQLGYTGSNITEPLGADRINIYDPLGEQGKTKFSGSVGIRYRLTSKSSLSTSAAIGYYRPLRFLHEDIDTSLSSYSAKDFTFEFNPNLKWSYYGKFFGKQQSFVVAVDLARSVTSKSYGYLGGANFDHSIIFNPAKKVSLGFYTGFAYNFWKKCDTTSDPEDPNSNCSNSYGKKVTEYTAKGIQSFMSVAFIPFFEYAITPKYSFRTVFNWFSASFRKERFAGKCSDTSKKEEATCKGRRVTWTKASLSEKNKWQPSIVQTQSVGLGIAYSRDIYIYPNFQFNIKQIKPKLTVASVSVSFSL